GIRYFDADLLGKLLEQRRIEHTQGQADLIADLVLWADGDKRQPPLAELLAARQVADLLDPVGVEDALAGVEAPTPGVVDGAEEGSARAVSAENQERRLSAVGTDVAGVRGIDLAGTGLVHHAAAVPEDRLDLLGEEFLVLRLVGEEAEDGRGLPFFGEERAETLGDRSGIDLGLDAADDDRENRFDGGVAKRLRRVTRPGA